MTSVVLLAAVAAAQNPTAGAPTATATTATAPPPKPTATATAVAPKPAAPPTETGPTDVAQLEKKAGQVRALLDDELDPAVDPYDLFDISLDDERAIAVEAERLRRVVAGDDADEEDGDGTGGAAGGTATDGAGGGSGDGGQASEGGAGGAKAEPDDEDDLGDADPALLAARLKLDTVRLEFYLLTKATRDKLIANHEAKKKKSVDAQAKEELNEAERERQKAHDEKERALREAREARSEAERRLAEEKARLLGIKEAHAEFDSALILRKKELADQAERILQWQRPADEILGAPFAERPDKDQIDEAYDQLVAHLDELREQLATALAALGTDPEGLPPVGNDPLSTLPVELDRSEIDKLRRDLIKAEQTLRSRLRDLRWERTRQLMDAVHALDDRRLALVPLLSSKKYSELHGFGPKAFAQARDELSQVTLVVRYHFRETRLFVTKVRETGDAGDSALVATVTALKWLFPIGVFWWWRRRAERALTSWKEAAREIVKKTRRPSSPEKGLTERALVFYGRIRGPLEWLLLLWTVVWLLPLGAAELLEVQLVSTALSWTLGGQLVVNGIDAFFQRDPGRRRQRKSMLQTAELRLRTLRLIGRTIVTFGLILALTSQLVGEGTIYGWVFSTCWFSAIPIGLVIVRWWRDVIFHYVELLRKKGPLLEWVAKTKSGWQSLPAAIVGGVYLLSQGVIRFLRVYVLGFDLAKRALAYWFRRELTKQTEERKSLVHDSLLDKKSYEALSPEQPYEVVVPSVADKQLKEIIERIKLPGGSVYAIVGERGSGKTTMLQRIAEKTPDSDLVSCPAGGAGPLRERIKQCLALDDDADDEAIQGILNKRAGDNAMLVDNAHHLIQPVVDGLHDMDSLVALARSSSQSCTWVFAFDNNIWQLFSRARDVKPLFDDIVKLRPWSEDGIVRLLSSRAEAAELDPDFSRLVGELPEDADEIDHAEALERAQQGYYRLLWDYSQGNPGVSLHYWRASLRRDPSARCVVRLFEPPQTTDLDTLPDSAVFVMRAIIQLDRASVDEIVEATMLHRRDVEDAVRYATTHEYIEEDEGRFRVRWTWFRTITRFLTRRHLLLGPYQ